MESVVSDNEAVSRLQRGDEEALVVLYDRYLDRVYRFALCLLGSREEAEEVAGESFLQVFRHVRNYRGEGTFSGWLFRIARNLCFDRMRRGRRLQIISLDDLAEGEPRREVSPDPTLNLVVQAAMQQLPADYRLVLTMRDVDGLSNLEVAQAMSRTPSATKSLHFRARQALRDALAGTLGLEEQP